jgi:hypothetical protein
MTNIMLDIETLGLDSTAVVLSIGVTKFTLNEAAPLIGDSMLWTPNLAEQFAKGRNVNHSTLDFWRKQPDAAKASWLYPSKPEPVHTALTELSQFISSDYEVMMWANGITFDFGIMASLYHDFEIQVPWKYNAVRDARTIYRVLPKIRTRPEGSEQGPEHDPVADCIFQIWNLWGHWPFGN